MIYKQIDIVGVRVGIYTNDENVIDYYKQNDFSNHLLPSYFMSEANFFKKKNVLIYIINHAKKSHILKVGNIIFACYQDITKDIRHLSYLLLYGLQVPLQKRGLYYIHAAAVNINGRGYLIIGESQSGKTTLALELEDFCDAKIIGDDGVIIRIGEKRTVVCGNEIVLYDEPYDDRFVFHVDSQKYVATNLNSNKEEIEIEAIFLIMPHCCCKIDSNEKNCVRNLYEMISVDISGLGYFYFPENMPYPNQDTKKISIKRINNIRRLYESVEVYEIKGTQGYICESIRNIIEKM